MDADLELHAMAIYGLAWMDSDGTFHGEYAQREPFLRRAPYEIWAIEVGEGLTEHLRPDEPRLIVPNLDQLATRVVRTKRNVTRSGSSANGKPYRLHAIPSFDDDDRARMAIIVVGDPEPSRAAHRTFVLRLAAAALLVALIGIAVGAYLARRSLRPTEEAYEQRERFLGGAAHELRNPVASMRAVCESAAAGDESAETALARIMPVVLRTGSLVENLLLYARLESERLTLDRTTVRLDLVVEACVPDDGRIVIEATESTVVADPRLVEVAISNLIANAERHAGDAEVRVTVSGPTASAETPTGDGDYVEVRVEDRGPGFAAEVLAHATEPFVSGTGSAGVGLGLALTRLIAELHGGSLELENRPEGGARTIFRIPSSAVS